MFVEDSVGPLKIQARILKAPALKYGATSKQPTIVRPYFLLLFFLFIFWLIPQTPMNGAWNMYVLSDYIPDLYFIYYQG